MAAKTPLIWRNRLVAAGVEATPGTIEVLDATDATHNLFDIEINPQATFVQRPQQGSLAMLPGVVDERLGKCAFKTHCYGNSATPAWAGVFLPSCGLGYSVTKYVADAIPPDGAGTTQESITIDVYEDGLKKQIYGAMGNCVLRLPAGRLAVAEFDYTGIWSAPVDADNLDPTYITLSPLRVLSGVMTIGAWGAIVDEVVIDFGNVIVVRPSVNTASGYYLACIASRLPKITLAAEAGNVSAKDVFGEWLASTEAAFTIKAVAGSDDMTVACTELQFVNVTEGERAGLHVHNIEAQCNADDLNILFS